MQATRSNRTNTATAAVEAPIAREYLRVSHDDSGRVRSNAEQHADNVKRAERAGWVLGERYEDVGSASRYQRKARPGFDALVADLESGAFGADLLVIWESSRGSRQVSEWARVLEACQAHGILIAVTNHGHTYDPRVARDWRSLMDEAVDAEYESRKSSGRIRRSTAANTEAGRWTGGRRPYGYDVDGVTVRIDEAQVIRRCVDRVLAGESVRSIAGDLNARGITTSYGNEWHPGALAKVLGSARIAGMAGDVRAEWPAIITPDQHRRVVAVLASRTQTGRRGRTPSLLHGLLRCGLCGNVLSCNTDTGGTRRYVCRKAPGYNGCGSLGIKAAPVEELLGDIVTERLADVEARRAAIVNGDDDTVEAAELDRIAAERAEVVAARTSFARIADYVATLNDLDAAQRAVEATIAAKVRTIAPLDFVVAEGFVGRSWADLAPTDRRIVLDALVDHVDVGPSTLPRGSTRFEPERVAQPDRIVWKV